MKCSKKVLAATVAAAMIATMGASTVFADEEHQTTVKYDVTESYEWSVPTKIDFTSNATVTTNGASGETQNIQVTKNVITNGKKLQIALANENTFKITSGEGAELNYKISKVGGDNADAELKAGSIVLDVAAGTNSESATLKFVLTKDTTEKAGNYTGTVTYTAAIK